VYEIIWKNTVKPGKLQMTIYYGTDILPKYRNTFMIFNNFCISTIVTRTHLNVALQVHDVLCDS